MTTATLRISARNAEKSLNWAVAATLYEQAIAAYKGNLKSSLIQRDIEMLQGRAISCRRMV